MTLYSHFLFLAKCIANFNCCNTAHCSLNGNYAISASNYPTSCLIQVQNLRVVCSMEQHPLKSVPFNCQIYRKMTDYLLLSPRHKKKKSSK